MKKELNFGNRKSLDICMFLFQNLRLEAKRMTVEEREEFEKFLINMYSLDEEPAKALVAYLWRR